MLYCGIDPGANFTGVAVHDGTRFVAHFEAYDPLIVWGGIAVLEDPIVIIEDFVGSSRLNVYRKRTLEVLGYIHYRCLEAEIKCVRQIQQRRKAYVKYVPPEISGKDEIAAAAHVLAYLTRQRIIRVPNQ